MGASGIRGSCASEQCAWSPRAGRTTPPSGKRCARWRRSWASARQLGIGSTQTVRKWIRWAEVDSSSRCAGVSSDSATQGPDQAGDRLLAERHDVPP